jgi:hypothetical protein
MAAGIRYASGETERHARLKRLAFLWAQGQGFSACAVEVQLPKCRYRADVAAYRPQRKQIGHTAIFECKQALCDLRRDNCRDEGARARLEVICRRRELFETRLREHYPTWRSADWLFPEFDPQNFASVGHRGYASVGRRLHALQNRIYHCTKFEKMVRYQCANFFFLVLPKELFHESEIPVGWGVLIDSDNDPILVKSPTWHETNPQSRLDFLQRIAAAGTRNVNRGFGITFERVQNMRSGNWR